MRRSLCHKCVLTSCTTIEKLTQNQVSPLNPGGKGAEINNSDGTWGSQGSLLFVFSSRPKNNHFGPKWVCLTIFAILFSCLHPNQLSLWSISFSKFFMSIAWYLVRPLVRPSLDPIVLHFARLNIAIIGNIPGKFFIFHFPQTHSFGRLHPLSEAKIK